MFTERVNQWALLNGGPGSGVKGHQTQRGYNQAAKKADFESFKATRNGLAPAHNQAAEAHRKAGELATSQLKVKFHKDAENAHANTAYKTEKQQGTGFAPTPASAKSRLTSDQIKGIGSSAASSRNIRSHGGLRNTKAGQIEYDRQGRIVNFIPAHALKNTDSRAKFASHIERFAKTPVIANCDVPPTAKILNEDEQTPVASPVTDPKQATVEEQKKDIEKADEQKAIVNAKVTGQPVAIDCSKLMNASSVPSLVHVAPYGEFPHGASGLTQVIDKESAESIVNHFNEQKKNDSKFDGLLVDVDHSSALGKGSSAAGWITNLQAKDDGIWATVSWTPKGADAIRNKEFKYCSAVWNRADCQDLGNDRVRPLAMSELAIVNNPNIPNAEPITRVMA